MQQCQRQCLEEQTLPASALDPTTLPIHPTSGSCLADDIHLAQNAGRQDTPAFQLSDLEPGHKLKGPAIIIDEISTILVEPLCTAFITSAGDIRLEVGDAVDEKALSTNKCDPIQLAIFSHRL